MREAVPHHQGWTALSTALQPACLRQKQPEPSTDGSKARSNKLAAGSMRDAIHVKGIQADLLWHPGPLALAGFGTYTVGHYG